MNVRGGNNMPAILVVDDEKRIADTLVTILKFKGYPAEASYDGAEALRRCRESRPQLVISDVMMPGLNGIELAIAIRAEFADCSVLLFSGQAATADLLEEAHNRGHEFEILAKPIHPEALLRKVTQILGTADELARRIA